MPKNTRERGIDRAIDILDCLHNHGRPMVINELATAMHAPRSTIYQMVRVLMERSILDIDSDGRVFLGHKLFLYGESIPEQYSLIKIATPFIDALAQDIGENVELNGLIDWKQSILYSAGGNRSYFIPLSTGASYPLPLASSGRFLIDGFDEKTLKERIAEEDYQRHGEQVITLERFMEESRQAKKLGYSRASGLLDTHISSFSMPIRDRGGKVLATVCIVFPRGEFQTNEDRFLIALKQTITQLQAKLHHLHLA